MQYKIEIDSREPSYWGLCVCKEQLKIIDELIRENIDGTFLNMMVKKPKESHVTLSYYRRDLCNYWKSHNKQKWTLVVDSICYNDNVIAITLEKFSDQCENTISHITIAMTQNTSPYESNRMLANTHHKIPIRVTIEAHGPKEY